MTKPAGKTESLFDFSGGALCLDFCNTVSQRRLPEKRLDYLTGYGDLVDFARDSGVISPKLAREILDISNTKPREAGADS